MADSFVPRKEFLKSWSHPLSSFALLTFSSTSLIRLYSFPPPVISALRLFLKERNFILAYREDYINNCSEFTLQGKPWSSSKSIVTERLVVSVLAVILQSGFSLLTPLDYGREQDDRVALAFSKLIPPTSNSSSSNSHSPISSPSKPSSTSPSHFIVPFAVSFTSATTVHVISPPLQSTPAILGAVRSSWPRGIVSEKKIADACYEFKLKGFRWFQEDNYASDSLRPILSLLESLDTHSFSLLTSLCISSHSRAKDLWIFTGISDQPHHDLRLSPTAELESLPRTPPADTSELPNTKLPKKSTNVLAIPEFPVYQHSRMASAPALSTPDPFHAHSRSKSDSVALRPIDLGVLRKPAPRAQVPISVTETLPGRHKQAGMVTLPSTAGSSINMAGIGASASAVFAAKPDVQFSIYPVKEPSPDKVHVTDGPSHQPSREIIAPAPVLADRSESPLSQLSSKLRKRTSQNGPPPDTAQYLEVPAHLDSPASSPKHWTPPVDQPRTPSPPPASPSPPTFAHDSDETPTSPTLLGAGAFQPGTSGDRDTVIPEGLRDSAFTSGSDWKSCEIPIRWTGTRPERKRPDSSPSVPGAWNTTVPHTLCEEDEEHTESDRNEIKTLKKQDADVQIKLPVLIAHGDPSRKSEVGILGVIDEDKPVENDKSKHGPREREGWVMVNVEGASRALVPAGQNSASAFSFPATQPETRSAVAGKSLNEGSSTSLGSKTVGTIDGTIQAKEIQTSPVSMSLPSPLAGKRILSFRKAEAENPEAKPKEKTTLRQRWKRLSTKTGE